MENNNVYEKFNTVVKQKIKDFDVNLDCSINLDVNEKVEKILSVDVSANVDKSEALDKEANINGNVVINIVYLTDQNKVCNSLYTSVFTNKLSDININPKSKLNINVLKTYGKVQSLNSNIVGVESIITLKGYVLNEEEVSYLSSTQEDICVLNDELNYVSLVNEKTNTWTENIALDIKDEVEKVVLCENTIFPKDTICKDKIISCTFEVTNKIMYLSKDGQIKTAYNKSDIKQDIENEFVNKDSSIDIDANINLMAVKNNVETEEDNVKINIELPIVLYTQVYQKNCVSLITDLFSTKNIINTTISSFNNTSIMEPIYFEKKIEGNLTLLDTEPKIDKLLAVNYTKVVVTNEYIENEEYNISGVVTSNLIYFNEEESKVNSLDVEFPFVINTKTDFNKDVLTDLQINITDVDVMVKRGKDIYIDAVLKVRTKVYKNTTGVVTSNIEQSETLPEKDCSIEMYFAKSGEKVWNIAKKLFVSPQTIYAQNPDLEDVLQNDKLLTIYYKSNN